MLDRAYASPNAKLDPDLVKNLVPRMLGFSNVLNGIANGLERSAASADSDVGRLAEVARRAWDMRDVDGRRSAVLTSALLGRRKLTAADLQTQAALIVRDTSIQLSETLAAQMKQRALTRLSFAVAGWLLCWLPPSQSQSSSAAVSSIRCLA